MPSPLRPQNVHWLFCPHQQPRDVSMISAGRIAWRSGDAASAVKKSD
jgi:hypothetical protein